MYKLWAALSLSSFVLRDFRGRFRSEPLLVHAGTLWSHAEFLVCRSLSTVDPQVAPSTHTDASALVHVLEVQLGMGRSLSPTHGVAAALAKTFENTFGPVWGAGEMAR